MIPKESLYFSGKSAWMGHAPFAYWLVSMLKPKTIVELGTHWGDSFFVMCSSVRDNSLDTKCFAVDSWIGDKHAGFYEEPVFETVKSHNDSNFNDFAKLIRSDFNEAVADFEDGSIDLLHIDGFHTYEAVKNDFETWFPKLTKDAIVMFHDTHEKRADFGVYKFWEELMNRFPNNIDFSHSHGLGVISLGDIDLYALLVKTWGDRWQVAFESAAYFAREVNKQKGFAGKRESNWESRFFELEKSAQRLEQESKSAQAKSESLTSELEKEKQASQSLRIELDNAKANSESLTSDLEKEKQSSHALKIELEGLWQSKSWKITKPLRIIAGKNKSETKLGKR